MAVQRTETALAWLDQLFGPSLAADHQRPPDRGRGDRVPDDGQDGSAAQGLIVHEGGHNYLMGILANNEWKEGWIDEGFTSFQTAWFDEAAGRDPAVARRTSSTSSGSTSTAGRSPPAW